MVTSKLDTYADVIYMTWNIKQAINKEKRA